MVNRLLSLISERGLTPYAVEKALGFGNGAIKRFNNSSPSSDKIILLSNFLNVSTDYILKGQNSDNSLSEREELLIKWYRSCSPQGQELILSTVDALKDKYKKGDSVPGMENIVG